MTAFGITLILLVCFLVTANCEFYDKIKNNELSKEQLMEQIDNVEELLPKILVAAICNERLDLVEALINSGKVNQSIRVMEWTPLMWASLVGNEEIVDFLLAQSDIDVNAIDQNYRNMFHLAVRGGNLKIIQR